VHRLVNAAGDRDLIRLVDEAIAACKDALHDPEDKDEDESDTHG
jgi:hypothetical protein